MSNKVIAIGIESADFYLVDKWCAEGKLPNIDRIKKAGIWKKLISTGDVASASSWPTLHTGTSPAKHGISRSHRHLKTGTYEIHKQYANAVKEDPFWVGLAESGKRCAILDVPKSKPQRDFNGIHFVSWGDEHQTWKQESWPPTLMDEILSKFGNHPLYGWYMLKPTTDKEFSELRSKLLKAIEIRNEISKYIYDKEEWDLFLISYSELHWVGHLFWHLMDENHPEYNEDMARKYGDTILKCYEEIDKGLALIFPNDLSDTSVLVFSNIGMGPNYSGRHLVGKVLVKMGLSGASDKPKSSSIYKSPAKRWGELALENIEGKIPMGLVKGVKKFIPEKFWDKWTRRFLYGGNNWKDSHAFSLPSDYSGAIRINLVGREPNGKVNEGNEYREICQKIKKTFESLINPATNKKAVDQVVIVREDHRGDHVNELPDIVITWSQDAPINAVISETIGEIKGELIDKHTGGHLPYGFVAMGGNMIPKVIGQDDGHIMDIAPSILSLLGHDTPPYMDGKVLSEIAEVSYATS